MKNIYYFLSISFMLPCSWSTEFYWNSQALGFWCIFSECYHPKLTNKPRTPRYVHHTSSSFSLTLAMKNIYYFLSISFMLPCSWSDLFKQKQYPAWRKMFKGDAFTAGVKLRLYCIHKQWLYCVLWFLTSSQYKIALWRLNNFTNLL